MKNLAQTNSKGVEFVWSPVKGASGYEVSFRKSTKDSWTRKTSSGTKFGSSKYSGVLYARIRAYRLVDGKIVYGGYSKTIKMTSKK